MKRLTSVLTADMDSCYLTGCNQVECHHIFGGPNRKRSEKYGFVVPLRPDLHPNGARFVRCPETEGIDTYLKQKAQTYYEQHIGSREDFRQEFGKSWL